jgi:hypothetical protein
MSKSPSRWYVKLLPKGLLRRLEAVPEYGSYKLPVVVSKSKRQPSSTTEVWKIKLYKPATLEEFKRMQEDFTKRYSKVAFYYSGGDEKDGLIEYVSGGTDAPLGPAEVFGIHRYLHRLGYLVSKGDCTICPVNPELDETYVYTVVVGLPDSMSVCPVQCRHCYAKPAAPDSTLARRVEDMREQVLRRVKLVVENIVAGAGARGGVPSISVILWGGNSDPTLLSSDYYAALIEEFVEWAYEKKKGGGWHMSFSFNLSTSAFEVDEIRRLYRVLDDVRERAYSRMSRDDWSLLGYHDSLLAVTAYRPDLYHLTSEDDDAAYRYMDRVFKLPSPRVHEQDYRFNVFIVPTFIIDGVIEAFADFITAAAYWFGYMPLLLSPYGTPRELYRYFKMRSTGQVRRTASRLLWRLLHVNEKVKVDTCTYNAVFGGVLTPQAYRGHFVRIYVDPIGNRVWHRMHDGSWCPRGVYTASGCIYPPRPPPGS